MDQAARSGDGADAAALVGRLDGHEIARAFGVVIDRLVDEVRQADAALAARLEPALLDLLSSTRAAIK